jgi:hypothetical protein
VKRLIGLMLVVVMVMLAPAAAAQSSDPTVDAYGGVAGDIQDTLNPPPAVEETQTVGTLPFTGLDLALAGGAGVLLLALGFGLRRASRNAS